MSRKLIATPAVAGLAALPIAGIAALYLSKDGPFALQPVDGPAEPAIADGPAPKQEAAQQALAEAELRQRAEADEDALAASPQAAPAPAPVAHGAAPALARDASGDHMPGLPSRQAMAPQMGAGALSSATIPDQFAPPRDDRERLTAFEGNPLKAVADEPVSTFSIDVDTASYAFVRRTLKDGALPQPDTVRVEEMVNYFPYDWAGPRDAATPFNTTVSVMPTPWNDGTRLMHVAIKGYELQPAARPASNLVFLIDVSGSMDAADKLPLLKASFRMLVGQMQAADTVSIVTYAGNAGTVLEPTKGSDKATILAAIDSLQPGGSTAGEAGIREAYRLAQQSFVKGGVNRVMLATDGDFNVGQSDDAELKRLIEDKRRSGVFLSVLGFGRGNLNDRLMQELAQNGNGQAAYVDTLAEAQKTLVEEAASTLFPIAKDVKIQVEFNPATVAEYRLIGYETRALKREDFNDDRVDAGEIGSGHSVTAIYEITPKGSAAQRIDDLRYGAAKTDTAGGVAHGDEYAFVKIRYKQPDGDTSRLIETPVSSANEISSFAEASTDQRFSVAVAAFGQKLRHAGETAGFGYGRVLEIAEAARGADPFGYRAEFLSLVRLAAAMDPQR